MSKILKCQKYLNCKINIHFERTLMINLIFIMPKKFLIQMFKCKRFHNIQNSLTSKCVYVTKCIVLCAKMVKCVGLCAKMVKCVGLCAKMVKCV